MEASQSQSTSSTRILKIVLSIIMSVVAFIGAEFAGVKISELTGLDGTIIMYTLRSLIALVAFLLLGGKKFLTFDKDSMKNTWKFVTPLIIINCVLGVGVIMASLSGKSEGSIDSGVGGRILYSMVLSLLVGINEEIIFRGLFLGGLLLWFGHKKNGTLIAAIIAGLLFGYVHVAASMDFSNVYSIATSFLKTIASGIFGFIWSYCILNYKNLWGAITSHGFFDWVVLVGTMLKVAELNVNYVSNDSKTGIIMCIYQAVIILLYIPVAIKTFKGFRELTPTNGPFSGE